MKDPQFAQEVAQHLSGFITIISRTKDPERTLIEFLLATHKSMPRPRQIAVAILDLIAEPNPVEAILHKRNSPIVYHLITVCYGPLEKEEIGDKLWGEGWGVAGRYEWKGVAN